MAWMGNAAHGDLAGTSCPPPIQRSAPLLRLLPPRRSAPDCAILAQCLGELAGRYPGTKFVKIVSTDCIPHYPDGNLPTVGNLGPLRRALSCACVQAVPTVHTVHSLHLCSDWRCLAGSGHPWAAVGAPAGGRRGAGGQGWRAPAGGRRRFNNSKRRVVPPLRCCLWLQVLLYRDTKCVQTMVGLRQFGGHSTSPEQVCRRQGRAGAGAGGGRAHGPWPGLPCGPGWPEASRGVPAAACCPGCSAERVCCPAKGWRPCGSLGPCLAVSPPARRQAGFSSRLGVHVPCGPVPGLGLLSCSPCSAWAPCSRKMPFLLLSAQVAIMLNRFGEVCGDREEQEAQVRRPAAGAAFMEHAPKASLPALPVTARRGESPWKCLTKAVEALLLDAPPRPPTHPPPLQVRRLVSRLVEQQEAARAAAARDEDSDFED